MQVRERLQDSNGAVEGKACSGDDDGRLRVSEGKRERGKLEREIMSGSIIRERKKMEEGGASGEGKL